MNMETITGDTISSEVVQNYFKSLVNRFFKIIPIKEENCNSLTTYMKSLQKELIGCKNLINFLNNDALFLSLISILQFFIDNPDCEVGEIRREVFHAISICNKLKAKCANQ